MEIFHLEFGHDNNFCLNLDPYSYAIRTNNCLTKETSFLRNIHIYQKLLFPAIKLSFVNRVSSVNVVIFHYNNCC